MINSPGENCSLYMLLDKRYNSLIQASLSILFTRRKFISSFASKNFIIYLSSSLVLCLGALHIISKNIYNLKAILENQSLIYLYSYKKIRIERIALFL